jgi:hypothetical protein
MPWAAPIANLGCGIEPRMRVRVRLRDDQTVQPLNHELSLVLRFLKGELYTIS